jgi:D-psicose/D-tagatose/L-ribulose 3-epimerase
MAPDSPAIPQSLRLTAVRFGANTFIWTSPFATDKDLGLLAHVRALGFDLIEIAVEDPALVNAADLKAALAETGLGVIVCGAFGPDRNLAAGDPALRLNADRYVRALIELAAELGSPVVAGPMYSAVGKERLATAEERAGEWRRAAAGLRALAEAAGARGVRLAIEPLNRFETDMINVVEQGLALIADVGSADLGLHLDTFHMHLEEKDSGAAIRRAGERLFHLHACENDRGVPGSGQVRWEEVASALDAIGYDGAVVIESFTPAVQSIARAVCIWRDIAPSQDAIAADGLAFLRRLLQKQEKEQVVDG